MMTFVRNILLGVLAVFSLCQCDSTPTMKINNDSYLKQEGLNGKIKKISWYDATYNAGKLEKDGIMVYYLIDSLGNCTDVFFVNTDGCEETRSYHAEFYPNGYMKSYVENSLYSEDGENMYRFSYNSNDSTVIISEYLGVNSSFKKFLISMSCVSPNDTMFRRYDQQGNLVGSSYRDIADRKIYVMSKFDSQNRIVESILDSSNDFFYNIDTLTYMYTDNGKTVYRNGKEIERYNEKGDLIEYNKDEAEYHARARYEYVYDSNGHVIESHKYERIDMMPPPPATDSTDRCKPKSDEVLREKIVKKYDEKGNVVEWVRFLYNDCEEEVEGARGRIIEYEYYE